MGCSCFLLCHVLPVGCQEGKCPAYLVKERSAAKAIGNPRQPLVQTRGFETELFWVELGVLWLAELRENPSTS